MTLFKKTARDFRSGDMIKCRIIQSTKDTVDAYLDDNSNPLLTQRVVLTILCRSSNADPRTVFYTFLTIEHIRVCFDNTNEFEVWSL